MSVTDFVPFADESRSLSVGGLSIDNRVDRVSVYGAVDVTRDRRGLEHLRSLLAVLERVAVALESDKELPDEIEPPEAPTGPRDPFA